LPQSTPRAAVLHSLNRLFGWAIEDTSGKTCSLDTKSAEVRLSSVPSPQLPAAAEEEIWPWALATPFGASKRCDVDPSDQGRWGLEAWTTERRDEDALPCSHAAVEGSQPPESNQSTLEESVLRVMPTSNNQVNPRP
jgi:hypothetical protein